MPLCIWIAIKGIKDKVEGCHSRFSVFDFIGIGFAMTLFDLAAAFSRKG